jgi:hypothetical protein
MLRRLKIELVCDLVCGIFQGILGAVAPAKQRMQAVAGGGEGGRASPAALPFAAMFYEIFEVIGLHPNVSEIVLRCQEIFLANARRDRGLWSLLLSCRPAIGLLSSIFDYT